MDDVLEKVTAFITRENYGDMELLFLRHPDAGIQIPAGTVEDGESHLNAVLREVQEETGLSSIKEKKMVSYLDVEFPKDRHMILDNTKVYARPDPKSIHWAEFRRGLSVTGLRKENGFTQVQYFEYDQYPEENYITYNITGWVPKNALTQNSRRYFYHLTCHQETPREWEHMADDHRLKLFWAPMNNLPNVISPQRQWLGYFLNYLNNKCKYAANI